MKKMTVVLTTTILAVSAGQADAYKTSRATCYDLQGQTASGTYVNKRTAAHNFLWPGTKIRIVGRQAGPHGVRKYVVRDTGPALRDGHFDLWASSGCMQFGVRTIHWKIGWSK